MILSFIVPVYNVAPYLRKCVDSLLAQDYEDYEIILVDDGSTDDSGAICDEYAKKPTSDSSLKGRVGDSFASVWGSHTADRTQYELLKTNAIENRKTPTEAESVMWGLLKGNNLGLHFRRQHIILDYIVDFICLDKGLVIELDGGYHNNLEQKEYDERRTAHLQRLGYTELRFTNEELLVDPDAVIARIKAVASKLPSLQGGGGGRPQIRVIHQKNAGLSAARNTGIAAAKGKYICFVDSDDFWQPNVLGSLMAQVEREQLDVLRFDYQNVRIVDARHFDATRLESKTLDATHLEYEVFEPNKSSRYIDYRTDVIDGERYLNERMSYACYAVMYIMRREIVPTFTEGILYEDTEWTPRMLATAGRVNATQRIVYNYLIREGSITKKYNHEHILRKNNSLMQVNASLQNMLQKVKDGRWIKGCIADNVYCILNNVVSYDYSTVAYWVEVIKNNNMLPLYAYKVRKMTKLRYGLINLSPRFYCLLRHFRITSL